MDRTLTPRRDGGVDMGKALAICAVLLIHCSAGHLARLPAGSLPWLAACFYGSLSRWAVAMFLLCSGALMNDPDRALSLKNLFSRYVPRLLVLLLLWSALYCLSKIAVNRDASPLPELLRQAWLRFLNGNASYHLYYLFYALGLYLALPVTRLIAKHATERERYVILALWGAAGILLPFLRVRFPLLQERMAGSLLLYDLGPAFAAPGLGLLGWSLRQRPSGSRRLPVLCFLLGFLTVFAGTWVRSVLAGGLAHDYLSGLGPGAVLMAAGLFRLARRDAEPHPAVRLLSRASTCVYLVHPGLQFLLAPDFFKTMGPLWSVPVQAALLLAASLGVYGVLRRVPVVRTWFI